MTRQRLAVLGALEGQEALTALDVHQRLRRGAAPGLATVYRTLSALAQAGEVDTFQRDAEQSFRLCRPGHHHHLVCERCGSVEEVPGAEVERWVARVARRRAFTVTGHTADVYGRCRSCG